MLYLRLAYLELQALLLQVELLLEVSSLGLLLSHKLLVVVLVLAQGELLLLARLQVHLLFALDVAVGLPCRVYDLAAHQVLLLHFFHELVYLLGVEQLFNGLLVVGNVAVDEVQAASYDLQLVHYLLQLKGHQLGYFLSRKMGTYERSLLTSGLVLKFSLDQLALLDGQLKTGRSKPNLLDLKSGCTPSPLFFSLKFSQTPLPVLLSSRSKLLIQIMTSLSSPPVAKQSPFQLKSMVLISPSCPKTVQPRRPCFIYQILILLSLETEAMWQPKGWKAILLTGRSWALQCWISLPSLVSHTLMVPSTAEAAMQVPSGVNLQLSTQLLCSMKVADTVALVMSHNLTLLSSEQDNRSRSSKEI